MKRIMLLALLVVTTLTQAQITETNTVNAFRTFRCDGCTYRYFVSSNTGILNTPLGYKIGFFGKTGAYLGARFGSGKIENWEANTTQHTRLFSVTAGLIKPLFMNEKLALHTYFGAGYGEWFNNRRNRWSSSGYEIEAGLMFSYKRIMLSVGGAILDAARMYPTGDATVGLGVRF